MKRIATIGLLMAMGTAAQAALTQLDFNYRSVDGDWDGTTFSWAASADSFGEVAVTANPAKRADFGAGSLGVAIADVAGSMTVTGITATTATGSGSLTLTDVDGSTITANVSGDFYLNAPPGGNDPTILFTGTLNSVVYAFGGAGTFDGVTTSFSTSDFSTNAYLGFLTQFEFDGNWFTAASFSTDSLKLIGSTQLPVPGAALLGVLGLTAITSIRRRFAA